MDRATEYAKLASRAARCEPLPGEGLPGTPAGTQKNGRELQPTPVFSNALPRPYFSITILPVLARLPETNLYM
jgi:hypothetical protein